MNVTDKCKRNFNTGLVIILIIITIKTSIRPALAYFLKYANFLFL